MSQISTGKRIIDEHDESLAVTQSTDGNGVLLTEGSTNTVSRVFTVRNDPVRLIAFGLMEGVVKVKRILLPNTTTDFDSCGRIQGTDDKREKNYMVGCSPVVLCPEQDEIVIDSAGTYRIVYEGGSRDTLHVVVQEEPVTTITNNLRGIEDCCK